MSRKQAIDILVVGGGMGGCAAARAAASLGLRVVLTEETDWLGGQVTSQAVPPDEHRWIEQFGCTRSYRTYRNKVRAYYRDNYRLSAEARSQPFLNPGGGRVSGLCHEPRVALAVIEDMLAPWVTTGRLEVKRRRKPVAVDRQGDRVRSVTFRCLESGREETLAADYVLDATELGDLLPLASVDYVTGAESQAETGEPHAVEGPAQPENVQAITWCFPMAYDPDCPSDSDRYRIEKPAQYERWRSYVPELKPAWSGPMLSWAYTHPITLKPITRVLLREEEDGERQSILPYRQIVRKEHFDYPFPVHDVTLVNWPQNDYLETNLIDQDDETVARCLEEARQLSLSFFYWLQNEAPNADGTGAGYAGLHLRPDLVGTDDGLAKYPYIREARRIKALFTVTENHVGAEAREGKPAESFYDSVGVGCYRIDLHPSTGKDNYIDISSLPFRIPLGALLPESVDNLIPAAKNIGTTHISNGCYRLHPVEWNIGESAGFLAAFAISRGVAPRAVREQKALLEEFQNLLCDQGVELSWPETHAV